jgi:hypothetical protein
MSATSPALLRFGMSESKSEFASFCHSLWRTLLVFPGYYPPKTPVKPHYPLKATLITTFLGRCNGSLNSEDFVISWESNREVLDTSFHPEPNGAFLAFLIAIPLRMENISHP